MAYARKKFASAVSSDVSSDVNVITMLGKYFIETPNSLGLLGDLGSNYSMVGLNVDTLSASRTFYS